MTPEDEKAMSEEAHKKMFDDGFKEATAHLKKKQEGMTPDEELLHAQDDADCMRFLLVRYKRWVKELRDAAEKTKKVITLSARNYLDDMHVKVLGEYEVKHLREMASTLDQALKLNYEKVDAMILNEHEEKK